MNTRVGFEDQLLICTDCCADFVWPTDEQEFYRQKGYAPPEGCGRYWRARKVEQKGGVG